MFNPLRLRQNGRHFPDNIFKYIFLTENVWISINISLKFLLKGPINNVPALVQIMVWHRPGDKSLSELLMVSLVMCICVTQPEWVNNKPWMLMCYFWLRMLKIGLASICIFLAHLLSLVTWENCYCKSYSGSYQLWISVGSDTGQNLNMQQVIVNTNDTYA